MKISWVFTAVSFDLLLQAGDWHFPFFSQYNEKILSHKNKIYIGYSATAFLPLEVNTDTNAPLPSTAALALQIHRKWLATLGVSLCSKGPLKTFDVKWEEAFFFFGFVFYLIQDLKFALRAPVFIRQINLFFSDAAFLNPRREKACRCSSLQPLI